MGNLDNVPRDGGEEKEINLGDDFFMDDGVLGDHHEDTLADDGGSETEEDSEM
ncbi:MAG: hypothetical protein AAB888_00085 [Patescibacteria group bacterium]